LAPRLRTDRDIVKWIALQTCVALIVTVPTSLLTVLVLIHFDLDAIVPGARVLQFAAWLTVFEVVVFTPPIALRSVGALRALNVLRDRLEKLAAADPLTGLLNRRGFEQAVAGLAKGGPMAALICDLDQFKRVNDIFGHEFGDRVLCATAELLSEHANLRPTPLMARLGGEEFVVLLPGAGVEAARSWAELLRARLASRAIPGPSAPLYVTMSVGVAGVEIFDGDLGPLITDADEALYRAKREGRNRVVAAEGALRAAA